MAEPEPDPLAPITPSEDLIERLQAFAEELRAKQPGSDIDDALERIRRFMAGESDGAE